MIFSKIFFTSRNNFDVLHLIYMWFSLFILEQGVEMMSLCNKILLSSLVFLCQIFLIITIYVLYEVEIYNYLLDHEFIDKSSWPKPITNEEELSTC